MKDTNLKGDNFNWLGIFLVFALFLECGGAALIGTRERFLFWLSVLGK